MALTLAFNVSTVRRMVEGSLASLGVYEDIALVVLGPFGVPWRWERKVSRRLLRLLLVLEVGGLRRRRTEVAAIVLS